MINQLPAAVAEAPADTPEPEAPAEDAPAPEATPEGEAPDTTPVEEEVPPVEEPAKPLSAWRSTGYHGWSSWPRAQ